MCSSDLRVYSRIVSSLAAFASALASVLCLLSRLTPVSYTHLDVYKRQASKVSASMFSAPSITALNASLSALRASFASLYGLSLIHI